MCEELAYKNTVECVTGIVSRTVLKKGMLSVYNFLSLEGKKDLMQHIVHHTILAWIYCTNATMMLPVEMGSVVLFWPDDSFTKRMGFLHSQWEKLISRMWKVGEGVGATRPAWDLGPLHPFSAGVYVALMMAQIQEAFYAQIMHKLLEFYHSLVVLAAGMICKYYYLILSIMTIFIWFIYKQSPTSQPFCSDICLTPLFKKKKLSHFFIVEIRVWEPVVWPWLVKVDALCYTFPNLENKLEAKRSPSNRSSRLKYNEAVWRSKH